MKTVKQILIEARELISDPARWTQGAMARDENGTPCRIPRGTKLCSIGAIGRAGWKESHRIGERACSILKVVINKSRISEFNDTHTHAEVLAAFTRAIEQCEE